MPDKQQETRDYLKPSEISLELSVSYRRVLDFLGMNVIPARKVKGRWRISHTRFERFKASNQKKIKKLQQEYVALYWGG